MKKWIKRMAVAFVIWSMILVFSGCQKEEAWEKWTEEQLAIDQGGQITYCIVDQFDTNYYDIEELTGMAVKEAAEFNGANRTGSETPVTILEVAAPEGHETLVRVTYRFHDGAAFTSFMGAKLYYETVEETFQQKHVFTGTVLYDDNGSITLDEPTKVKLRTKHVVVTDAKTVIHLPSSVLYCTKGVQFRKDGSVDTTACEDTVILILAK